MPEEELITYGPPGRPLTRRPINSDILVQAGLAEDTDLGDYWRFIQEFSENALKRQKSILLDKCKTISSCLPSLTRDCFGGTLEDSATLVSFFETQCARITARISQLREARSRHEAKRSQLLEEVKAPSPVPLHQIALAPPAESVSESVSNDAKKSLALERFEDVSSKVKPVLDAYEEMARSRDPRMESVKLKFRMAINKRILQIANSRHQISNVTFGLVGILNEGWSQHGSNLVSYIVVVIAQKILDQAEAQVSLHMPSAFPIAQVVVDVSVHQRAVLFVLLYLMMKRCPYAVPRYVDKELFSSEAEFKVASGYLLLEGGIEGDQPYIERMGGILNLLGAIIQTSPSTGMCCCPAPLSASHMTHAYIGGYSSSYDLSQGWLWMASVLNVRPQPITPFMICAFLEVCSWLHVLNDL